MTKAELIERVARQKDLPRDLTKKAVAQIVDAVFMELGDYFIRARVGGNSRRGSPIRALAPSASGGATPRSVRNPQTASPSLIPAQATVVFRPGQDLKDLLNDRPNAAPDGRLISSVAAADAPAAAGRSRARIEHAGSDARARRPAHPCRWRGRAPHPLVHRARAGLQAARSRPTGSSATWSPPAPTRWPRRTTTWTSSTAGPRRFSPRRRPSSARSTRSSARSSAPAGSRCSSCASTR